MPGETIRTLEEVAGELFVVGNLSRRRLAVMLGEHRLGVKQIDMAGAAVHEKLNHRLRARECRRGRGPTSYTARTDEGDSARNRSSPRSAASTIPPKPPPQTRQCLAASWAVGHQVLHSLDHREHPGSVLNTISIHVSKFVRAQEHLARSSNASCRARSGIEVAPTSDRACRLDWRARKFSSAACSASEETAALAASWTARPDVARAASRARASRRTLVRSMSANRH